jgi:N-acetylneuraminic acid mutarotase
MNRPYTLFFTLLIFFAACKKNPDIIKGNPPAAKVPALLENYTAYTWGDDVPILADSTITGTINNMNVIIDDSISVRPTRINGDTIYFKVPNTVPYQYNAINVTVDGKTSNQVSLTLHLPLIAAGGKLNLLYGSSLAITGQFFNPVLANNSATLGSIKLNVSSATPTQLVIQDDNIPMSTTGWIRVYTGKSMSVTNGVNYNYYRFLQPAGNFPGIARINGVAVSVNGIVYFGLGTGKTNGYLTDWWKYDPASSTWTALTACPGGGYLVNAFTIGSKVYVLTASTFLSYDTSSNTWATMAAFPGGDVLGAASFSSTQYGYVACGQQQLPTVLQYVNNVWRYDPQNDSWQQLADFPGTTRLYSTGITLNNKGYMIGGFTQTNSNGYMTEAWSFDLATETWSQVASLPTGAGVMEGFTFTANNKIYSGGGTINTESGESSVIYEYDAAANTWAKKENILDDIQYGAAATSVNNVGYVICGQGFSSAGSGESPSFFKFTP